MTRHLQRDLLHDTLLHDARTVSYRELTAIAGRGCADRAVAADVVTRVLPGRYAATEHAASFATRAHAALAWVGVPAALTGEAAAFWAEAIDAAPDRIHLTVRHGVSRRPPSWLRLISTTYDVPHITTRGMSTARLDFALAQGFGRTPSSRRGSLAYATLNLMTADAAEVSSTVRSMPIVPARRELMALLADATLGAESGLEGIAGRKIFTTAEFSHLLRQHCITIAGRRIRFDAFDPQTLTAIEFDGAAFHGNLQQRERDIERDAIVAGAGILTLRFGYRDVTRNPQGVRARLRAVLEARRAQLGIRDAG